jgi:trigger factor
MTKPESWKRAFSIEVPKEEIEGVYIEKIATYKKRLTLPGFRPGKIPLDLVKSRFGKSIYAETVEDMIQKQFEAACKENNVTPISRGAVKDLKAEEGSALSFTVETEIEPDIDISGYDKLKIRPAPKKIKDDDVDKAVEDLRERSAEFKDIDCAAKKGDSVSLEYVKVVIDGQERKDFKSPNYPVEVGKSQLKDFDKGLLGAKAGDTVEIDVRFPKDFAGEAVANKEGTFTVKILKIMEKIVPEFSPEFLKKLGDFDTIEKLKERVRADLEKQELDRAKKDAHNEAVDKLIKDNPFDVPPSRIETYIDGVIEESARYRRPGEPVPARDQVMTQYRESAVRALKRYRIIDFVSTKLKIKASQEEVDKEIQKIAAMYNQPFDTVKQTFRQNGATSRIRADIREQKTLDYFIGEYTPEPAAA